MVKPGDVITYTLTASNTSSAVVSGALARDDTSGVLDDAMLGALPSGLVRDGGTLTWSIPTLAAGKSASISYPVTVTADGATLTNTAVPVGVGGTCTTCTTTSYTPSWTLAKTSDPASGTVVNPGDVITYTLSVTNTGPAALEGAVVSDDLSDVLDDATLGDLADGLSVRGAELTWRVPAVPVGETVHVSYPVRVDVDASGATLANEASASTNGATCLTCMTKNYTPAWTLAKTSTADGATVAPGDVVDYTLTVTNTGPATLHGASVSDDLSDVLDDATLGALPTGATASGSTLTWAVPDVAPGGSVSLDYRASVNDGATGATLRNTAAPASVGGSCVGSCATVTYTPSWTLSKTSDAPSVVKPGDVITYTLTASNTSSGEVSGASASDDASGVLDDATLGALPSGLVRDGNTITWAIPTLAAGKSASVSYTVTVTADGATLTNTVTPVGVGGTCTACSTMSYTPSWTLAKTSDQAKDAVLQPGDVISYTLTVANTGPVALTGARVHDDVADVVDDATLGDLPSGLALADTTLTWDVPEVPVGGTASVTYTATVTALGAQLTNTAAPATNGGSCLACSTTAYTPKWSLAKTSDVASGGVVKPGDEVAYTLTVTNEARTTLTGAQVSDDLSDVLDDATLVALPDGATLDGTTLTWSVPEVAVGGAQVLTYSVKLHDDARGATLHNVATPLTVGGSCPDACQTTAYSNAWTLTKTSDPGSGATVEPGDRISYTLTVTNTGPVALSGATVEDDMSNLLDDADLVSGLPDGTTMDGDQLTWAVPDVPVGATTAVHYTVAVKAGAYGHTLGNVAYGDGATSCAMGVIAPFDATATDDCSTKAYTPGWTLEKTSDPASGSTIEPGSDVTYTLRVTNTSLAVVSHAVVTDDLSDVLRYATLGELPDAVSLAHNVFTWTVPTLQPGESAVVTYTVTVHDDDEAYNGHFTNVAVPNAGGSCPVSCTSELSTIPAVVDPIHTGGGSGGSSGSTGTLAYTGADLGPLGLGVVALAAGLGLLALSRKRRPEED